MSEERFATLETMVAYHEDTLQKLNEVVYKQQRVIDRLEERIDTIYDLLQSSDQGYVPGDPNE
ncbi:MAG TPA: SlyX family protein [Deltaproteobacteria bacterium]|nr:SlyX family protein [Deltaproteobacteria bacterium]